MSTRTLNMTGIELKSLTQRSSGWHNKSARNEADRCQLRNSGFWSSPQKRKRRICSKIRPKKIWLEWHFLASFFFWSALAWNSWIQLPRSNFMDIILAQGFREVRLYQTLPNGVNCFDSYKLSCMPPKGPVPNQSNRTQPTLSSIALVLPNQPKKKNL